MSLTNDPQPPPPLVLAEWEEVADAYVLELLPGAVKSDLELLVCGRCLTVSGTLAQPDLSGTRPFRYDVPLPDDIDVTDVSASHRGGVLSVRIGRARTMRPRRIQLR
jgi:HSP20 family molecular chaperone IbpA